METKTKDGVNVDQTQIEIVAMILGNCSEGRLEELGVKNLFMSLATKFISVITEEEMRNFIGHNVAIKLINVLA